jgi:hypothetical protein
MDGGPVPPEDRDRPSGPRGRRQERYRAVVEVAAVLLVAAFAVLATYEFLGSGTSAPSSSPSASCPIPGAPAVAEPDPPGSPGWMGFAGARCDAWTDSSAPVVFWLCPGATWFDCLASSWSLQQALGAFGLLPATEFAVSPSGGGNLYAGTPGLNLSGTSARTPFLDWFPLFDSFGGSNETFGGPLYGPGVAGFLTREDPNSSLPFLCVGGLFFRTSALVPATVFEVPGGGELTPAEVEQNLTNGTGPVYEAVNSTASYLEAYLWRADTLVDIVPPSEVEADPTVAAIERSIA